MCELASNFHFHRSTENNRRAKQKNREFAKKLTWIRSLAPKWHWLRPSTRRWFCTVIARSKWHQRTFAQLFRDQLTWIFISSLPQVKRPIATPVNWMRLERRSAIIVPRCDQRGRRQCECRENSETSYTKGPSTCTRHRQKGAAAENQNNPNKSRRCRHVATNRLPILTSIYPQTFAHRFFCGAIFLLDTHPYYLSAFNW